VPVTPPVGAGLTPSDVTSVEPSGIPVVPTDPLAPIPSGEVPPSEGTAVSGSSGSSTWANAGPAHNKHQAVATISNGVMKVFADVSRSTAAIGEKLVGALRSRSSLPRRAPTPISFAVLPLGASLSNIGQSFRWYTQLGQKISSSSCSTFWSSAASNFLCFASNVGSPHCSGRILDRAPDESRDRKVAGSRERFN
jgi:hypothetical protein